MTSSEPDYISPVCLLLEGTRDEALETGPLGLDNCLNFQETNVGAGGADWRNYLARHPAIVKRRVRKGIPDCLRGVAWQLLSGGRDLLLENEGGFLDPDPHT